MADFRREAGPDELLTRYSYLFSDDLKDYPVLDLACGDGHNGIFLASKGFSVVLADRSEEALSQARLNAQAAGVTVQFRQVNLEQKGVNPLEGLTFSAVLVFRYLHRPLKIMGQLYGLLYLSPKPLTLDEMAESLSISKGNVSINIRALERWNMVKTVGAKVTGKTTMRPKQIFGR